MGRIPKFFSSPPISPANPAPSASGTSSSVGVMSFLDLDWTSEAKAEMPSSASRFVEMYRDGMIGLKMSSAEM